jgi:acyl-CoA synthetase (AMP-forming)/AMP-acid ligase II
VTLSHRNLVANTESIVRYLALTADDSVLVILPLFYSYGNSLLLTHVHVGGELVLASDFVFWNRALDLLERRRATGFAGVPSSYAMLLERSDFARRKFPDLRYLTCAGGGLPPPAARRLRSIVPHAELFLMYGQTEASARLSTLLPRDFERKLGSIGQAIPGVELDVRGEDGASAAPGEPGELVARGANVMVGYWNDPQATARVLGDGWLHTGDLARKDEEGFFWIVGRKSDMIKSGAYRIGPEEVEEVLRGVEGVGDVAVVGQPDEVFGEVPVAFVVPAGCASAETILEEARRRLPRHKWIRAVRLIDALPRTTSGKVRRGVLRERLRAGH